MAKAKITSVPTESQEQQALFTWALWQSNNCPELKLLFHVPNGGTRKKSEAGRFRAEGVKPGVPDVCLPVARGAYHGLYIELKRMRGSAISKEQHEWIQALAEQGYHAIICKGWEKAASEIMSYINLKAGEAL